MLTNTILVNIDFPGLFCIALVEQSYTLISKFNVDQYNFGQYSTFLAHFTLSVTHAWTEDSSNRGLVEQPLL